MLLAPSRRLGAALPVLLLAACSGPSTPAAAPSAGPTTAVPQVTTPPPSTAPTASATPRATPSPSPTAVVESSAPPPGGPTCQAKDLTLTDADTLVTQQNREQVYVIRTTGPTCTLQGYPTVTLLDASGKAIPARYGHGGYGQAPSSPTPLSLSRGTSVSFSVSTPRTGTCLTATTIVAGVPGTLRASTTARVCGGVAGVSAIRRLDADS